MADQQAAPPQSRAEMDVIIKAVADAGAPALATMLSGTGANVALTALGRTLLADSESSTTDILQALQSGKAEIPLQVQEAEQSTLAHLAVADAPFDFSAFFPAGRSMTAIDAGNTADARAMQIKLHDKTNQRLAYAVTAGFFVLIMLVIFYPSLVAQNALIVTGQDGKQVSIPNPSDQSMRNILFTLLGVVATGWSNIIGFYFGSSAGSEQKSQTLSAALSQATATNASNQLGTRG